MRTDFAASAVRMGGVAREVGVVRDRVLEAVAEERDAARNERRRSHEWREARGADLAELKEAGEALRGWLAERGSASQGPGARDPGVRGSAGGAGEGDGAAQTGADDGAGNEDGNAGANAGANEERLGARMERVEQDGTRAEGAAVRGEGMSGAAGRTTGAAADREPVSAEGWRAERDMAEALVLRPRPVGGGGGADNGGGGGDGVRGARDESEVSGVREHGALLLRAATVSSAQLVCHRDAWEFVAARAGGQGHYRTPSVQDLARDEESGEGEQGSEAADGAAPHEPLVRVTLSGRSLIAVLVALWEARHEKAAGMGADWAMAVMTYERIRAELVHAEPEGDGVEGIVRIRLDDRVRQPAPATAQSVR